MIPNGWHCQGWVYCQGGQAAMIDANQHMVDMGPARPIITYLIGKGKLPDMPDERLTRILLRHQLIMEDEPNGRREYAVRDDQRVIKTRAIRARRTNDAQHQQANTRHFTPRKKATVRKVKSPKPRLFD